MRKKKWMPIAAYRLVKSLVLYFGLALFFVTSSGVSGSKGAPWTWPRFSGMAEVLGDHEFILVVVIGSVVVAALQAIFLLPVRQPKSRSSRGVPVAVSLWIA